MSVVDYLNWHTVCDQCFEIQNMHEHASDREEYGINWYEFINTNEKLFNVAEEWWKKLPLKDKNRMINDRINQLKCCLEELEKEANKLNKG